MQKAFTLRLFYEQVKLTRQVSILKLPFSFRIFVVIFISVDRNGLLLIARLDEVFIGNLLFKLFDANFFEVLLRENFLCRDLGRFGLFFL